MRREWSSLPQFLDRYKGFPGLVMHWVLMGPSGRETRSQTGGVIRDYTWCRQHPAGIVKSITNTFYLANVAGNPHTFEYRCVRPWRCKVCILNNRERSEANLVLLY